MKGAGHSEEVDAARTAPAKRNNFPVSGAQAAKHCCRGATAQWPFQTVWKGILKDAKPRVHIDRKCALNIP